MSELAGKIHFPFNQKCCCDSKENLPFVQIDSNMSNLLITNFGVHHGPVLFNLCVADDILSYVRYNCVDKMHHCRGSEEVTFSFTKLLFTVKY